MVVGVALQNGVRPGTVLHRVDADQSVLAHQLAILEQRPSSRRERHHVGGGGEERPQVTRERLHRFLDARFEPGESLGLGSAQHFVG